MKTRLITAGVSAALFLGVLFIPFSGALTFATSLICAMAVYEVLSVTRMVQYRGISLTALVFALIAPFFCYIKNGGWVFVICLLIVLTLGWQLFRSRRTFTFKRVGIPLVLSTLVTLALSCLAYLRTLNGHGLFYVFLALLMAWMADSGAYFVGTFLGKHKLCPRISPKKTVEGFFGGIIVSIVISLLAAYVYQSAVLKQTALVSYFEVFALSLICAPLSVVGDLFASILKRCCHVKDFGKLFPGHGGMMDRFDSLLLVLPVVLWTVQRFPLVYYLS